MKNLRKLPPYGALLAERQKYTNLPFLVVICIGKDSWNSAKKWNASKDNCALVLPSNVQPHSLSWPVARCSCIVEWNVGPSPELILGLAKCLLKSGAESVVVWPVWIDFKTPPFLYDASLPLGQRWAQSREILRVYHVQGENHAHL